MISVRERNVLNGYTLGQITDVLVTCGKTMQPIIIETWNSFVEEDARVSQDTTVAALVAMIEGVSILGGVRQKTINDFVLRLKDHPKLNLMTRLLDHYGEAPETVELAYSEMGHKTVADGLTLNKLTDRIKNAPKYVIDALIAYWNEEVGDKSRYIVVKTHSGPFNAKDLCDKIAVAAYYDFHFDDSEDEGTVSRFADRVDETGEYDLYGAGPWNEPRIFLTGRSAMPVDAFFAQLDSLPDNYTNMLLHYWAVAGNQDRSHPEEDRTRVSQIMAEVRASMNEDNGFQRVIKFATVLFERDLLRVRTSKATLPISRLMPVPGLTVATVASILMTLRGKNLEEACSLYNEILGESHIYMPAARPSLHEAFLQMIAHYPGFMLMGKFLRKLGEQDVVNWNIALNSQRMNDDLAPAERQRLLNQAVGNPVDEETFQLSGSKVEVDTKQIGIYTSAVAEGVCSISNPNPDQIVNPDSIKLGHGLIFQSPSGHRRGIVIGFVTNEAESVAGFIVIARTGGNVRRTVHHTIHLSQVVKNLGSLFDTEILNG